MDFTQSRTLYESAVRRIPGGVHSSTRVRSPHPIYFERAQGQYLWDVDGNRWLDFVQGNGAIILGHGHPAVQAAVRDALAAGITTGSETRQSVEAAELLLAQVPTADAARFANSGTEAVMHAMDLARSATGRPRIAKVEGAYHGWHAAVHVSAWPDLAKAGPVERPEPVMTHRGVDQEASRRTLILPFNDVAATRELVEEHRDELAAVLVEPVMMDIGYVEATPEYLGELRRLTERYGIVFVFDELLTGFRIAPGGAQEYYGIRPDLSTFGKAIANGYPIAAVAGRREIMDEAGPGGGCAWVGTFNAHAVNVAAASASLRMLAGGGVWRELQAKTETLISRFTAAAAERGEDLVVGGRGGNFHWYFAKPPIYDYRSAARANAERHQRFAASAFSRGIWLAAGALSHHSLTLAHDEADLDALVACLDPAPSLA